jgi:hypothetical protein
MLRILVRMIARLRDRKRMKSRTALQGSEKQGSEEGDFAFSLLHGPATAT